MYGQKQKKTVQKEKAIFIDECWALLSTNELTANYILEIFKTIRGYGGAAVCASQDLEDFFSLKGGKYGKGVLNNTKTKIILNLEHKEAEVVKRNWICLKQRCLLLPDLREEMH